MQQSVLLTKEGRAKVVVLGLPRATYSTKSEEQVDAARYMAPECVRDSVTGQSHVYSLGFVIWQCLTGLVPFHNLSTFWDIISEVVEADTRPEFPADVYCPGQLRCLVQECWQAKPEMRPSCQDVLRRLGEIQSQLCE